VEAALEKKFGPAKSSREHAGTVHAERGHEDGKPHVDVRQRGGYPERNFELKEE
jgi:hypothetical protein